MKPSPEQETDRQTLNALNEAEQARKQRAADYLAQSMLLDRPPEFEPKPATQPKWKAGWDGNRE